MKSVEEELKEIEADWELSYLDATHHNYRHRVQLKKEEVIVQLCIPESYPEVPPEFEFGWKEIDEKMQQSTLRIAQQNLLANIGKPMIGSVLEKIWKHIKSATMENDIKISENSPAPAVISQRRQKKKKTKYTLACSFGVAGSNHAFQDVKTKPTIKKSLNDSTNSKESQKVKTEPKSRDEALPMKTARDDNNRAKQQQQQNEDKGTQEFSVVKVILDNSQQTNLEIAEERGKDSSVVDIGNAEMSRKGILETADEAPQVTASEKTGENHVEETALTAGLEEPTLDKMDKTEEDMASPAIGQKSCDASQVDDKLQIGVQEDVDEDLNNLPFQLESLDISANDGSPREAPGGKQRHDGRHSKSFSGSRDGHPYHQQFDHRDRRGHHNRDRNQYSRRGRGGGRGGSGSHWDSRDPPQYQFRKPNFIIGIELDDISNEKLSRAISSVVDTKNIQIHQIENCCGSMSKLYISSQSDASKLAMALKSVCQRWRPINTAVHTIDVGYDGGYATISLHSRSLDDLYRTILRNIERDPSLYHFLYLAQMRIGTIPDSRKKQLCLEGKINLKIISLKLFPLEEPNFDFRALSTEKFELQGAHEQERKRYFNDSYGHEHGKDQDKRFRLEKDREWETNISRRLSAILRHGAMGLHVDEEGFIEVKILLAHQFFKYNRVEEEDIARIVANNGKKRFTLEGNPGNYKIRANQGHTVQVESLQLKEITNPEDYPNVVHGTNLEFWDAIKERGLSKMRRNHIHMTTSEPRSDGRVISGMRNSSNCFVYIDLAKAMKDGIKFFLSDNGVILSEGEGVNGVLDRKYFSHAAGIRRNGERFELPIEWEDSSSKARLRETSSTDPSEDRSETKDPSTSRDK